MMKNQIMESNRVFGSLSVNAMIQCMQDGQYEFWYVNRRGRLIIFKVTPMYSEQVFSQTRSLDLHVTGWDEFKQETTVGPQQEQMGSFYDGWYNQGHFFANKNNAVKYMYKRVLADKKDLIIPAKKYVTKHPECLV